MDEQDQKKKRNKGSSKAAKAFKYLMKQHPNKGVMICSPSGAGKEMEKDKTAKVSARKPSKDKGVATVRACEEGGSEVAIPKNK